MNGSPKVIESLARITEMTARLTDKVHDQEHYWEHLEYPKLESVFDEMNRKLWDKIHHRLLKRLFDLGGTPEDVTDDPAKAYRAALQGFSAVHEECQKLYDLVDEDDDYVTIKMLSKVQACVESWINYLEAKIAQVERIGTSEFLGEQL